MSRKRKKKKSTIEEGGVPTSDTEEEDELEQAIQEAESDDQDQQGGILEQGPSEEQFFAPQIYRAHTPLLHRIIPVFIAAIVVIVVIGTGASIFVASQLLSAKNESSRVRASFESIEKSVGNLDFRGALSEFPKGEQSIRSLITRVDRFSFLTWVPVIGKRISESQKGLRVLVSYFTGGQRLLAVVEQIGGVIFTKGDKPFELYMRTLSRSDKAAILEALVKAVPTIHGVQAQLRLAGLELDALDLSVLSKDLVAALRETKIGGAIIQSLIEKWLPLAEVLPSFLGYPDEKTYLILLQDTSEVRATGGFISHYGILKLHNGEITLLKTDNVYNLDDRSSGKLSLAPPDPMSRHFPRPLGQWFLRDSNWAPDFSQSARQAEIFYALEGGREKIDGVIAATPELVRSLLRYTGPIRVEGRDYAADTLLSSLEFEVREGHYKRGIEEGKRKEIFGQLVALIGEKLLELPLTRWLELYTTLETRLNEKHVLIYSHDPRMQAFARERNWTGEMRPTKGDFLMVADTTFATLKTESVMDKRINYSMREDPDGFLVGRLDLTYTNRAVFTDVTTTYRDWIRVYVPDGSTLVKATGIQGSDDPASLGTLEVTKKYDKLEFAGYASVEPRRTKVVTIEYRLPDRLYKQVQEGSYSLLIQKQPGISNQRFDGDFSFLKPIESYQPLGFFNVRRADTRLSMFHDYRTDQEIIITLKKE
ncbi:DUF4012 domain-containing protein [Candidatus Uhrbacteria bacterium]|nr:DUF4012 domain-containing protein [Candidatus Uhrbacteria bacterium]